MTLEFAGNMLCSAGVSYFHVYPNGDVYRCLADYNARRPPMFNLKRDGWKGAVDPTVCDHERCYNACDLDWTTKWQVDGQGSSGEDLRRPTQGHREGGLAAAVLAAPGVAAAPDGLLHLVTDAGVQLHLRLLRLRGRGEADQERLSLVAPRADRRRVDRHLERHPGALRVRHPQHHWRRAAAQRSDDPRAQHGHAEVRLLHHLQHQPQHHGVHPRPHPSGGSRRGGRLWPCAGRPLRDQLQPAPHLQGLQLGALQRLGPPAAECGLPCLGQLRRLSAPALSGARVQGVVRAERRRVHAVVLAGRGQRRHHRALLPPRADLLRGDRAVAPQEGERAGVHGLPLRRDARQPSHARADGRRPDADGSHPQPVSDRVAGRQRTRPVERRRLSSPASGGASSGCASCAPARRTVCVPQNGELEFALPHRHRAACRPASTRCGSTC